jgi:8-oxo-dGTP pyrophosphatase MutT (NUDIX family)
MEQQVEAEPIRAAGVICKAPSGRVLLMHRTDGEGWAWPAGGLKDGETPEQAAWREVWEECGYRLGDVGAQLTRSTKNGVDFTTFICPVESEFVPRMNHEHDSWMWADPEAALAQAKSASEPMAVADSADEEVPIPAVNADEGEGLDDPADPVDDLDDETADAILAAIEDLDQRLQLKEGFKKS